MAGFLETLTEEQKKAALAYKGPEGSFGTDPFVEKLRDKQRFFAVAGATNLSADLEKAANTIETAHSALREIFEMTFQSDDPLVLEVRRIASSAIAITKQKET